MTDAIGPAGPDAGGRDPGSLVVDPARAVRAGEAILAGLGGRAVDVVVTWDEPESAVLSHVLARELGTTVVRAVEIEGLIELLDRPRPGSRALLVARAFPAPGQLRALENLVRRAEGSVVGIGAVEDGPPLRAAADGGHLVVVTDGNAP